MTKLTYICRCTYHGTRQYHLDWLDSIKINVWSQVFKTEFWARADILINNANKFTYLHWTETYRIGLCTSSSCDWEWWFHIEMCFYMHLSPNVKFTEIIRNTINLDDIIFLWPQRYTYVHRYSLKIILVGTKCINTN